MQETDLDQWIKESRFLITGGCGFIGSNIVKTLLEKGAKKVRVMDNFSTGFSSNIKEFEGFQSFEFFEADILDVEACVQASKDIDYVSHQAALGSVPRSITDPGTTNNVNSCGFLNIITAAKKSNEVKGFVYASSSSVYGDSPVLPKKENVIGNPMSPYAVSKLTNELYATSFATVYGFKSIGLRYFNVFGPKQNPNSQYSAVIPLFMKALMTGQAPVIYGDGLQSRDFTFIDNVVQANLLSLYKSNELSGAHVFNIAVGNSISLLALWEEIARLGQSALKPVFREARPGDVQNSLADISLAKQYIGYRPVSDFQYALQKTLDWYKSEMFN